MEHFLGKCSALFHLVPLHSEGLSQQLETLSSGRDSPFFCIKKFLVSIDFNVTCIFDHPNIWKPGSSDMPNSINMFNRAS